MSRSIRAGEHHHYGVSLGDRSRTRGRQRRGLLWVVARSLVAPPLLTAVTTVYTVAEQGGVGVTVIHVRKVGNSSVVTLPPDVLAQANLREGDLVHPTVDRAGRVILEAVKVTPRETRREIIRNAARRDRAVLRRLAEYDRK